MCGFVGCIGGREMPGDELRLQALRSLVTRGPDGEGEWSHDGVWLGFRRLAILDLSARSDQPMVSADGDVALVFNGEIYNYVELRAALVAAGRTFSTTGDTEVLLQGYLHWGLGVFERLNGMWACAIVDPAAGGIVLCRDRFGEKPLYLGRDGGGAWWFSSQLRTLADAGVGQRRLDAAKALGFLLFGATEDPEGSFVRGIDQVPPGTWTIVGRDGPVRSERWFSTGAFVHEAWSPPSPGVDSDQVWDLLDNAVALRLRSDVAVGTSLSGGIDSSAIVASMRRVAPDAELTTFTASFPGDGIDEWDRAKQVGDAFDCTMHRVEPRPEGFVNELDEIVLHQGGPIESPTVYAQWCVMRAARGVGVTVLLDGQGADETWGGYPKQVGFAMADTLAHLDLRTARRMQRAWRELDRLPRVARAQLLGLLAPNSLRHRALRLATQRRAGDLGAALRGEAPWDVQDGFAGLAILETAASVDLGRAILPRLLRYADRNSMRWSREVRLPFLDPELAAVGLASDWGKGFSSGWTKLPLRTALDGLLPPEIVWRRQKTGYEIPDAQWRAHPLVVERVQEADRHLVAAGLITPQGGGRFSPWRRLSLSSLVRQYGLSA